MAYDFRYQELMCCFVGRFDVELKSIRKKFGENLDFLSSVPKDSDVLEVWN